MIYEETRHIRSQELAAKVSSFKSEVVERRTTDFAAIGLGTTEGDPTTDDVAGSGKPDPPTC